MTYHGFSCQSPTTSERLNICLFGLFLIFQPQNDSITRAEADELRAMSVDVFGVGLGSWLNHANVRQIATVPSYYGHILEWMEAMWKPGLETASTAGNMHS